MKLAVGIDGVKKEIDVILEFLDRLQFKSPSIDFVSVIEEFRPLDMILGADEFIANATGVDQMSLQKQLADKALDQATEWSRKEKIAAQTHILKGQVGNRLLEFASTHHTDLIALGSSEKAPLERIVLGSIGRKAIINAHASVLIAKKMQAKSGKIKAVLATDHSEYANSCFQLLKEFKPQGIGEIIVVSAYSPGLTELMSSSSEKSQEDALQLLS